MDSNRIDEIIAKHGGVESSLIQVLLELQQENRWLPAEMLQRVSDTLGVPLTRVRHVATFYKTFSVMPKGRHRVHVCLGTACHVRGADRILDTLRDRMGIQPGETDLDLKFSLESVNCLGCCALGPVMEIDGTTHGKLSPADAADVLKGYE
jgi:NADH-quinone oxidoreductase subunit E